MSSLMSALDAVLFGQCSSCVRRCRGRCRCRGLRPAVSIVFPTSFLSRQADVSVRSRWPQLGWPFSTFRTLGTSGFGRYMAHRTE